MDHADEGDDDVFVYTGGQVPEHLKLLITHARIDESVDAVDDFAFNNCHRLLSVEFHVGIERVGVRSFAFCVSLRRMRFPGVQRIACQAFTSCRGMTDVEFGAYLERIEAGAFHNCTSLRSIYIPSIQIIDRGAFIICEQLTEAVFGEELREIHSLAFFSCLSLRRIVIPLKNDMFNDQSERGHEYRAFKDCVNLTTVDLVGGVHKTISSLHMESWRNEMKHLIGLINHVLPRTVAMNKTDAIEEWIGIVLRRINFYKAEHHTLLREAMSLLELAVWKAKLGEVDEVEKAEGAETDISNARRKESRVKSGASVVVTNVFSFLVLA